MQKVGVYFMAYDLTSIKMSVNLGSTAKIVDEYNALIKQLETKHVKLEVDVSSIKASVGLATQEIEKAYQKQAEAAKKAKQETEQLATQMTKLYKPSLVDGFNYDSFTKAFKQAKGEALELQNVVANFGKNNKGDKAGALDSVMVQYTNNLGKTVVETLAWAEKTNKAGEVVARQWQNISTKVMSNEQAIKQLESGTTKVIDNMSSKMAKMTIGKDWIKDLSSFQKLQDVVNNFKPKNFVELAEQGKVVSDAMKQLNLEINKVKVGDKFASEFNKAQNSLESFKASMGNKISNINIGNNSGVANQLQVFDQLKTKFNELQNFKLTTTNISEYISRVKELNGLYAKTQTEIKSVNASTSEMTRSANLDSKVTNKVKDFNAQLDIMLLRNRELANNPAFNQLRQDVEKLKTTPLTQFNDTSKDIARNMSLLRSETSNSIGVFNKLGQSIKSAFSFMSLTMVMYSFANQVREMPDTIISLDTALVDLKKTSSMTAEELENFYKSSTNIAKSLGVTTEEIINQASAWSRLGYSTKEQAETMAKVSAIFKSISPDMTMDEATDGLVSAMKAFDISSDKALDGIASKINAIGNTQAVNNKDIVDFLTRSSSAMAEANNTLEETIALGTAATEITRDAASVGQVLKSTSMRIRGYSEETEAYTEDVEVLSGKIANLTKTASTQGGISLFTDESKETYKSTYQLLKDISSIYEQLSDKKQAELLEALAGKRNGQAVAAMINNFETAEKSMNTMASSQGNAMQEMEIIYDSLEYKINRLRETWVGLTQDFIERDAFKNFIDSATSVLELIDDLGGLSSILKTILGVVVAIKAQSIANFILNTVSSVKTLGTNLSSVMIGLKGVNVGMENVLTTSKLLTAASGWLGVIVTAFSVIGMASNKVKNDLAELKQEQSEVAQQNRELADTYMSESEGLKEISDAYKEIYNSSSSKAEKDKELATLQDTLIDKYQIEKERIDLVNGSYSDQLAIMNQLVNEKPKLANQLIEDDNSNIWNEFFDNTSMFKDDEGQEIRYSLTEQQKKDLEDIDKKIKDAFGGNLTKWEEGFDASEHGATDYLIGKVDFFSKDLNLGFALQNQGSIDENMKKTIEAYEYMLEEMDSTSLDNSKFYNDLKERLNGMQTLYESYSNNLTQIQKNQASDIVNKAFSEMGISSLENVTDKQRDSFSKIVDTYANGDSEIVSYIEDIIGYNDKLSDSSSNTSEEIANSFQSNLSTVTKNLSDVQSLYSKFQSSLENNNGKFVPFDISDLEGLREEFGGLGEVFDDFVSTLANQNSSAEDVQKAFDDLTGTYLVTSNVLDGLNTSNRDMIVSQLELQGVQNASQVVTKDLAIASENLAQQGIVLSNVTAQEAVQFINSANCSEQAKQSLALYVLEKMNANSITLMTNGDIDNLISLISYLGGATTALQRYKAEKAALDSMDSGDSGWVSRRYALRGSQSSAEDEVKVAMDKAKQSAMNSVKMSTPTMSKNGASSSGGGGSGSKSSTEKYAEYVDSIYDSILKSLQDGTEKVDRQIAISQSKLENLELLGKQDESVKANADLEKLYQDRIDIMKKSSGQIVSLRDKMVKELQAKGYTELKGLDLTNISQLGVDKVIAKLEQQIDSANNSDNKKLAASLTYKKDLIEDYCGNIINANSEINSMAKDIIDAQNELADTVVDNINKVLDHAISKANAALGQIDLQKMLLDTDGDSDIAKADSQKLVELNKQALTQIVTQRKATEDALKKLRLQGLSDESEEIQSLLDEWRGYESSRLSMIKEIAQARKDAEIDAAQDEMDDMQEALDDSKSLLDLTVDMLKQETEAKKDALEEQTDDRKDALKEQYEIEKKALEDKLDLLKKEADARKDALKKEQDERNYNDDVSEKQKQIANVQAKITELSLDKSTSAQKKRKELEEELVGYKEELDDLQYDRSIELQTDAIDEELEIQEDKIDKELEALENQYNKEVKLIEDKYDRQIKEYEDYLSKESRLRQEANDLIASKDRDFYERLKAYATEYSNQTTAEFTALWDSAYEGMEKYGNGQLGVISNIESMTAKIISLREEIEELNNTSYKQFIEDDASTEDDDYRVSNVPSREPSSSNSSSNGGKYGGLSSKDERAEYRDRQLEQLISLGDQMRATSDTSKIKNLKSQQASVASTIGAYLQNGVYYIMINNKKYPVRSAVGVRHDGLLSGRLGDGLKPSEMILKATKDEWVFTGNQMKNLESNMDSLLSANGKPQLGGDVILQVSLDGATITKDTLPTVDEMLTKKLPKAIKEILNDTLFKKGIK